MDQGSSSQSQARKPRGRGRPRNVDASPGPTVTAYNQLLENHLVPVNLIPQTPGGRALRSSSQAAANLNPNQNTAVPPLNQDRNLIPENQTQRPQELERRVLETTDVRVHTFTVNAGEDVAVKIMSFVEQRPKELVWILYAHGVISRATIGHTQSPQTTTHEGKYQISTLVGSFVPNENRIHGRNMTVSLANLEGHVFGGLVAGPLVAESCVSVGLGCSLASEQHEPKQKKQKTKVTSTVTPTVMPTAGASTSTVSPTAGASTSTLMPTAGASTSTLMPTAAASTSTVTPTAGASPSTAGSIPDIPSSCLFQGDNRSSG